MQNYAHITKLGDWLVCFPLELSELSEYERDEIDESRFFQHVLLFRTELWDSMRTECGSFPSMDSFPVITRSQLLNLWLREIPHEHHKISRRMHLKEMKQSLLASDPLPETDAQQRIDSFLQWVDESPEASVEGQVFEIQDYAGQLNTLHFDGNPSPAWTCMTVPKFGLVLDNSVVFEFQ